MEKNLSSLWFIQKLVSAFRVNPYSAMVIYLHFQQLEVVSHYSDLQPQVGEYYSYLFKLIQKITNLNLKQHFITNNSDLIGKKI